MKYKVVQEKFKVNKIFFIKYYKKEVNENNEYLKT